MAAIDRGLERYLSYLEVNWSALFGRLIFKSESISFRRTSNIENPRGLEWEKGYDLFKSDWDYIIFSVNPITCERD